MALPEVPVLRSIQPCDLARCDEASSFLQSGFWGSFKAAFGWNARAFLIEWDNGIKIPLLLIRRKLGPCFSFSYVPWGPELPESFPKDDSERKEILVKIADLLRKLLPNDTAFIRFDAPWYNSDGTIPKLSEPFVRAGADVQPPDTVLINLKNSEDEILASMKAKWRYNIRLSAKKGVLVKRLDKDGLGIFYNLYVQTAKRDKIAIHSLAYYERLFIHASEYTPAIQDLRLYVAEYNSEPLSALILLIRGTEATYLYGASSDTHRNLMAPYALQWHAMQDAKQAGCTCYDLFGIPPNDNPSHPMIGLYRFKTGFGGTIIHRSGSYDYAYNPVLCSLFKTAESGRKKIRSIRKAVRLNKKT